MRYLLTCFAIFLSFTFVSTAQDAVSVMTFNIRYDNRNDPNPWPDRKGEVASIIKRADIVGLQEALKTQIDDLAERLPGYTWFGVGRDDGKHKGEFTCIFYRKDRFELNREGSFWLSETPEVVASKSWDAAITRICTWGEFVDKKSKKRFFVFNTHFDHRGQQARAESAIIINDKAKAITGDAPTILMGDFNSREDSKPYQTLLEMFYDTRYMPGRPWDGPHATFTNWKEVGQGGPIDYVFIRKANSEKLRIVRHEVVDDMFRGFYPSDHLPVMAKIELR